MWQLHQVALEQAGGHLSGPWEDDLTMIPATYLEAGGEFLVGVENGRVVAMGALRKRNERRAIELGYQRLVLDTTIDQRAAQALYRSEDYSETGRGSAGPFELILFEKRIR